MLTSQLKNVQEVVNDFTGKEGEPGNDKEIYVLKSMWIMMCAEFEGSLKNLVDDYIDSVIKNKDVKDMHICFLIQNFFGKSEEKGKLSKKIIMDLFKTKVSDISNKNFTGLKATMYKSVPVEKLFNSLGIFFEEDDLASLKLLDGIASTRDAIAHGDYSISITRKQLEENLPTIEGVYNMLKDKLK